MRRGSLFGRGVAGLKPQDVKALSLRLATLDGHEAMSSQPPVQPAPPADEDQAAVRTQHPRDLAWVKAATRLGDQVEEVVGVGEGTRAALLEGDPALGVESDRRYRRPNRLLRGIHTAHPRRGVLARQEEHPLSLITADLENPLGMDGHAEDGGGKRDERRRGHLPII